MADGIIIPSIISREDCLHCRATGSRCRMHETIYQRDQHDKQDADTATSIHNKKLISNDSRGRWQKLPTAERKVKKVGRKKRKEENQFLSALRKMTLSDTVSERQQRDRTAETAAYAEKSARKKANRVQKASQRDQRTKATATARAQRKAEANIAMQEVRAFEQKQAAERKAEKAKLEAVPLSKNQNQNLPSQDSAEASDELIGINGIPLDQSAEEFLARACDLIRQTLGSEASSLALQDQRGLMEALSLVSTARVLVPLDAVAASESAGRETGGFFGGESVAQDAWMEEEEL